jgi:hypothetical protein
MGGAGHIPSGTVREEVQARDGTERDFEKVLLIERTLYPALCDAWEKARKDQK